MRRNGVDVSGLEMEGMEERKNEATERVPPNLPEINSVHVFPFCPLPLLHLASIFGRN